ncbi:tRNA (N(6)-L-threonylcarbamoyladenosine(37)-C(2))-methylthiotransferase MtaB [Chlorobium phaeobacteroides]|jgi:threonylcarbamoyladenosine tRNA methylthiotransferase MtaB|uniref:RNA modification enzyme, MiaB family n=1 Tax=Chlorobium phaeobacteroides (strain DSM 266 / SMG 266 / 2430) TaxID=290317 RepID=A1BDK3_CHLPD|nr:tRNA (N(6)-L-threonylcarbamoyladenosine(37)-C(2))-methylthiotransferase MtaB [Chlorobium phaeobacteroides]ABL64480.1 RNA modification enzyme, MiaB family [Chlorobium phaeobacteroides DSM 266]MBV5319753.1 tRNA (N(6)-L-threonylcarbamoyladenosine(37)-C(2))-methylthiotransferase MtaB [Chlorobium phaeobacteroides]
MPKITAITLGCKLNYAESSAILDLLSKKGWEISSYEKNEDLIIINTCAVTKQAEQKCRQKIRKIIRDNPGSRIVVTGCYAQLSPEVLCKIDGVNAILGSSDKYALPLYEVIGNIESSLPLISVSEIKKEKTIFPGYSLPATFASERTRAFLKIQDGCDYGCAYCTIPFARGRSRSFSPDDIIAQASALVASGYREIVLTGVNIGDYRYRGVRLAALLRMLEKVPVARIRISSIEPDILDDALIAVVAASEIIAPHFHLPLQSGSDAVLRAMCRRYDTAGYRQRILRAVEAIADCSVSSDVMVGYPGESADDYRNMYRFLEGLPISSLHVFSCSVRPGTQLAEQVATKKREVVDPDECRQRSSELIKLGNLKKSRFMEGYVGMECMVLFEESQKGANGTRKYSGYTRNYLRVTVTVSESSVHLAGSILPVFIEGIDDDLNLMGRLLF